MEENKFKQIGLQLWDNLLATLELVKTAFTAREQAWEKFKSIEIEPVSFILKFLLPIGIVATIANIIKYSLIGYGTYAVTIREPFFHAILNHSTAFIFSILVLVCGSFLISKLSSLPALGARNHNFNTILGWFSYAMMISLTAGVFILIPYLGGIIMLIALVFILWFLWKGVGSYVGQTEQAIPFYLASLGTFLLTGIILILIQHGIFGYKPVNNTQNLKIEINDQAIQDMINSAGGLIQQK